MSFKKDDAVKIKYTTLTGVVTGASIDQTTFEVLYYVTYTDNFSVSQERAFLPSEIEAV
jgi:hypothetical protein